MWRVILVKEPTPNHYKADYFPRDFYYKTDAQSLVKHITDKGGDARIERV